MSRMLHITQLLPALPGLTVPKTYAAWPVWRDSATADVRFAPLPKKQAVQLFHRARQFERQTRQPGRQDGAVGRNGLAGDFAGAAVFLAGPGSAYITGQSLFVDGGFSVH